MPATAYQALKGRGHIWTVRPELRGLLHETRVCNSLSNRASAHKLDYVVRAGLRPWPRMLREHATW
eukprot:9334317-Lingulodinium_polyedra.AAC.1